MNTRIQALLEAFPGVQERGGLTPRERSQYQGISFDSLRERLQTHHPGEVVQIEAIDPQTGEVVFIDGAHGRKRLPLNCTTIGYRQSPEGVYYRGK